MTKCSKCGIEKDLIEFPIINGITGLRRKHCKACEIIRVKTWYLKNKDRVKIYKKIWADTNKENVLERSRLWYSAHPEKVKARAKAWVMANRDRWRERERKDKRERYNSDTNCRLASILRHRLWSALDGNFKSGSAVRDLGCSIPELKQYLESKFVPGMTWENYGKEWHIDHIIPLSFFDLQNETEFKMAVRSQNLQPLWAKENIVKGNKLWKR
jgi:hypothetical protein